MPKPNRWIVKAAVFLLLHCLATVQDAFGQSTVTSTKTPELYFYTFPSKQLFWGGETVAIVFQLYSRSEQPLLVNRGLGDEFVKVKVIGPDGNEVPLEGRDARRIQGILPLGFHCTGPVSANLSEQNHLSERRSRIRLRQTRAILAHCRILDEAATEPRSV